jgi:hypothetical protein
MSEAAPQLAYGRAATWSWRRLVRWAMVAAVALPVGLWVSRYGMTVVQHLRVRDLQRRCLDYTPAPGRVIYDNDSDGDGIAPAAAFAKYASYRNRAFEAYQRPVNGSGNQMFLVAFMGRRTSPAGNERLVTVTFGEVPPYGDVAFLQYIFSPTVETAATLFKPPAAASLPGAFAMNRLELFATPGDRLRILEGRPDPADASHFTIDYVHNGVPGTIDGWLNDDDTITFGPRAGEFVEQSSIFVRWSPVQGALPPGVRTSGPAVINPATKPVVPKKDDPRYK